MFIIHGSYDRDRPRGVVAERCNRCGEVTLFGLTQRYKVPHIYFIPLGSGELQETVLACTRCGTRAQTSVAQYEQIVPKKRARSMSLGDIIEATNPRLAQLLVHVSQLDGATDPRVQAACDALWEIGAHHAATKYFLDRLARWASLNAGSQARLLGEIDAWNQQQQRRRDRVELLRAVAPLFKKDVVPVLALLAFVVVTVAGLTAVFKLLSDHAVATAGIVATFVAAGISAVWAHRWCIRRAHRHFVLKILIPQAEARSIDLSALMADLKAVGPNDPEESRHVKALAEFRRSLVQILEQEGAAIADSPEADAAPMKYGEDPLLFLQEMARTFPTAVDGLLPFLALAVVAVAGLIAAVASLDGALLGVGIAVSLVAGGISGTVVQHWLLTRRQRHYFQRTLLPEARQRGLDAGQLLETLASLKLTESAVDHPLHGMARALPQFRVVLRKEGNVSAAEDVGRG